MAAAAPHVRMACPSDQQQHQKPNPDGDDSGPSETLKNGTAGFDESDDSSSRGSSGMVVKNRANNRESSGAEPPPPPFQDGGVPLHQTSQQQQASSQQQQQQHQTSTNSSNNSAGGTRNSDYASLDRRTNSDYQAYNQSTGPSNRDSNLMANDDFRGPVPQQGQEHPYNHGCHDMSGPYGRTAGPYEPQQSSQGGPSDVNSNSQPPNKMYPQYNQPQMRPSYPPRHVGPPPHSQQRGGYPMNNASSSANNSASQQRFLSGGPSLAQQTGPTPTLNQLLQAPNPLQRYHNSYEYTSSQGMHKGMGGEAATQYPQGPNSTWGNMRTQSGYPTPQAQPMTSSSMYRNQGGPMSDPSTKRSYSSGGQISSPSPQGGQYPPGPHQSSQSQQQQYHHSPYSSGHQPPQQPGQGPVVRPSMGQGYPQQGIQQYQQTPPPHAQGSASYDQAHPRQPSMSHHQQPQQQQPYGSHQPHMQQSQHHPTLPSPQQQSLQQQQPPTPQQQLPQPQQQSSPMPQQQPPSQTPPQQQSTQQPPPQQQQQQQPPPSLQTSSQDSNTGSGGASGGNSSGDDGPSGGPSEPLPSSAGSGGSATPGLRTPTTPPHPVVSPHRPVPSPSGPSSVGSPSLSPALGQQQSIPMPPRPSSSHSETSTQGPITQPPMAAQGYNQQMAPPAIYGNKMHQGMVSGSGSHMGLYPPQPSSHYPQSSYHRPPNSVGMQGFSSQSQSSYPSPASGSTYPSQTPMPSHRMPNHPGAGPPSYNTSSAPGNYTTNAQYSGNSGGSPSSANYGMNNMMPPPNQYPKASAMPPPTGGAQAAAQAAVMAAAASSSQTRQSPMYLRQHLQQKMYSGAYGSSSMSPVPPGAPGSGVPMCSDSTPMPPPSSTPSSQPIGMSQASPMPPQSSTPGAMSSGSSCDNSMALAGFTQTSAPSLGPPSTTITQSISSPVPTAVTVSSPSVMGSDMMPQGRGGMSGGPQGPLPPPIMDEGSQASNASASSSLPEERVETPKPNNKPAMSHPPTPNTLSSPGAASMSSFHDEFESVSSPSWPRTPASPVINNQTYDHHPIKRPDGMLKLYDMSDDPERRVFLDKLIMYNEERGTPISQCPTISKQPLDLFRLYMSCKERGGFVEVMKGKMWKDIAGLIGIGASSSAAYTLRKQYIKHILPFECKYDRGGIDPGPLISSLESNSRKKNAAKNAIMANQETYHQGGPMMDGYSAPYPGAYPPSSGPHPGMMPNADYPGHHAPYNDPMHPGGPMVNHSGSEGTIDPFSDDMSSSQYPQRHSSTDNYGYSQSATNSGMPAYSGNQPNMPPSGQYGYNNPPVAPQEPYSDQYPSNTGPPASESSYGNRNMVPEPYAPPGGGYPPNRTVGPTNPPQYPPYQGPCDQERYEQPTPQTPMMRPPSSSGIGPGPSIPQDPSSYPPHRYPNQPIPAREGMTPQQLGSYQGRPPLSQSQYPGPNNQAAGQTQYPQSQQDSYRGSDYPPQMSRLQSTLIQRLQPKNHAIQNYPGNQQGMYGQSMPPPNKVAPQGNVPGNMYQRDMYAMGPKRHGDFSKPHPSQDQYHMGSYPQQPSQGPYSDRSQYPYRPSHGVPPPSGPPQPGWTRDGRPYPSGPNQYQQGHREGWDMSRHDGSQAGNQGNWPRYGSPQQDHYPPHMGPKMGYNRGYLSPNKMQPHPGVCQPTQYGPAGGRKEIIFPPDSVEAVTPVMTKRRRVQSKDIASVDPWRLMMALKSGLLCESTWALDMLSVLICDDSTVLYFGLSHLPGLLEVLMDHYRRSLNLIFELAGELEVGFTASALPIGDLKPKKPSERKWYELEKDYPIIEHWEDHSKDVLMGDALSVLNSPNYTLKTRCRKLVKEKPEDALFLFDPYKKWDIYEGPSSDGDQWQYGIGEAANYVQTHFEKDERGVRFARIMEMVKNSKHDEDDANIITNSKKCIKRDCNSDTEEDESLFANSPTSRTEVKSCQNVSEEVPEENISVDIKVDESSDKSSPVDTKESDITTGDMKLEVVADEDGSKTQTAETKENGKVDVSCPDIFPKIRLTSPNRKRRSQDDLEDESYNRDEPSLCVTTDSQDSLARRCICISSLLRNFSFVPGNDAEMSKNSGFLMVMARLLLLHHVHSQRKPPQRHYDREDDGESTSIADSCSSLNCDYEWWWDMLHMLRENTLVTLANISGQLDLAPFPEEISFPLLDGLMHWVTCPSSYAQDPLPTQPSQSVLSPQRLSLEALCKLSVLESNVDLMMATPPWQRIDRFFSLLAKWLSRNEDQVLREFSVVLLSNLSQADSAMARAIALQGSCIPLLITFVEQAEQSALQVANSQGINALRENPELMGTTLDMVRRAAGTLRCLAKVPSNRTLFLQHQQRLLALVMSQILDQGVASIIADVLYECSQQDDLDDFIITQPPSEEKLSSSSSTPSPAT